MTDKRPFFPAADRVLAGSFVLIVAAGLTYGQWYATKGPLETLSFIEQHRNPGDSAAYASAVYHATYARQSRNGMWHPTGFATLGSVGTLLGLGLLVSAARKNKV